jgi:cardiolipin synthase C
LVVQSRHHGSAQGGQRPARPHSTVSVSLDGRDAHSSAPARAEGASGVWPLQGARDAFAARIALIRGAKQTLDVQYYIWHDDLSGSLLLAEIEAAADRGVSVRLILDDNGIAGLDARLAATSQHPNIDVRLYNTFTIRFPRSINWLFAFKRLSRRMHAKSLTADRRLTIVGGRNIGDEYFGAKAEGLFDDLDVLAQGPVVDGVLDAFDRHWRSESAIPAERVLAGVSRAARQRSTARAASRIKGHDAERYRQDVRESPLAKDMGDGVLDLIQAQARAVAVFPAVDSDAARACGLARLLPEGLERPARELIIISGYFVPTAKGSRDLIELARSGVAVRVLTNSFAATDVGVVHAGYAPRRQGLLEAGVELSEMPAPGDRPKTARKFMPAGSAAAREYSGRSLHAKAYIVDRRRLYIGSANFDPRSVDLNTELGLTIDSAPLAETMAREFEKTVQNSYRLSLAADRTLRWTDVRDDVPEPESVEPGTTVWTRALIGLLGRLPIERHL